jgi:hypothetical protein
MNHTIAHHTRLLLLAGLGLIPLYGHAAAGAVAAPQAAAPTPGEALLGRIEAKWIGVMTKIRGWDADAVRQFRDGYRNYPASILEQALAADTFEAMQEALNAYTALRAQGAMQKAFTRAYAMDATVPGDALDDEVVQTRKLLAKTLGDNARDLVFVPVAPCTVWDTRFATSAPYMGAIGNGVTRQFYSHLDAAGGNFTPYGGNPSCAEANQTFLGGRPYAAMMIVYVNNPVGNGWLTFYRDGDPDPSNATISVYYSLGPTRTQTVISKSSRGYGTGTYDIAVTGRFSTADASASVVGYFIKPVNITLPASTATTGNIMKGANRFIHNFGTYNTFIGEQAGNFTMTGAGNTASGYTALLSNTAGTENTANGGFALYYNTTGSYNTAHGYAALFSNT